MAARCLDDEALPEAEISDQCLPPRNGGKIPFLDEDPPVDGGHHMGGGETSFFAECMRHLSLELAQKNGSKVGSTKKNEKERGRRRWILEESKFTGCH